MNFVDDLVIFTVFLGLEEIRYVLCKDDPNGVDD